ncbi:MAG: hypothetical protein ACFFEY_01560 [Candidatus Thorarchaeota archaeon]
MYVLVLSHFDSIIGPRVFLNVPKLPSQYNLEEVARQMDFYSNGFFTYEYGELRTSNLIFTIPSPSARGKEENLMISIVLIDDNDTNLKIYQSTLEQFVDEINKIENLYKVFIRNEPKNKESIKLCIAIKKLLHSAYLALPKETITTIKREINLVMFDFYEYGESQIARQFREFISEAQYYKRKSEDLFLLQYKITLSTYPISILKKSISFFLSQLKTKHGLIFVIDMTNKKMLRKARHISNRIIRLAIGKLNIVRIPCLILINQKETVSSLETEKILRFLDDFGYDIKTVKYIPTKPASQDEIHQTFYWLLDRIVFKKLKSKQKENFSPIP